MDEIHTTRTGYKLQDSLCSVHVSSWCMKKEGAKRVGGKRRQKLDHCNFWDLN